MQSTTQMSNAAIAGMYVDLKLYVGARYSIALLVFFVPVCLAAISNLEISAV